LDVHETHNFQFQEAGLCGNGVPHDLPASSSGPQNKSLHTSRTRSLCRTLGMLATRGGESMPQVRRRRCGGRMWSDWTWHDWGRGCERPSRDNCSQHGRTKTRHRQKVGHYPCNKHW
jgi:hypothetical protein